MATQALHGKAPVLRRRRPGRRRAAPHLQRQATLTRKQEEEETKKYRSKAEKYKSDPEAADKLLKDAQEKAKKHKGPLSGRFDDIMTLIRLVRAYFKGDYRDVPWETIALATGALIYFISPVDLIPDPIPVVGYVDDAAVVGFVVASASTTSVTGRLSRKSTELGPPLDLCRVVMHRAAEAPSCQLP